MPTVKKIQVPYATGKTVYTIIKKESDGYLLNNADGAFASAPANPYLPLAEHGTVKGLYEASESRTAWVAGRYSVIIYQQTGASPAPASDAVIAGGEMKVENDVEVEEITLSEIEGSVVLAKEGTLSRLLGLCLENHVEGDIIRDVNGNKTQSILYLYDSASHATTHDGSTGLVAKYQANFTYDANGKMTLNKVTRIV